MADLATDDVKTMTFEAALAELEGIVARLEGGKAPLADHLLHGVLDLRLVPAQEALAIDRALAAAVGAAVDEVEHRRTPGLRAAGHDDLCTRRYHSASRRTCFSVYPLATIRAILDLRVGPGRERDRVTSLRRMSRLEGEPSTKRGLSREAVSIAENLAEIESRKLEVGEGDLLSVILREEYPDETEI